MKARQARTTSGDKTICLPMPPDQDYTTFVEDTPAYREYLDAMIEDHPELFPSDIDKGYSFHGFVESGKLHLRTRRILIKSRRQAYQIRRDALHDRDDRGGRKRTVLTTVWITLRGDCPCLRP